MSKRQRKAQRKRRNSAFKIRGLVGMFDSGNRDVKLTEIGDPLERLDAEIEWELFRPTLEQLYAGERKGPAGRKPIDPVLMFKIVILQRLYNLSDDQTEYQILDRASFQRFLGLCVGDGSPDAKTIWLFKERLQVAKLHDALFARFEEELCARGLAAKGGQIIDATIVEVPRQRNTREENAVIKEGRIPEEWLDDSPKFSQKDLEARWTKKHDQEFFGYKNHVNVDQKHKLIRAYATSDAAVHDSQMMNELLDCSAGDRPVYGDSAYRSALQEMTLRLLGLPSQIHHRPYRNHPLTDEQRTENRARSSVRARVEHVFGFVCTSMNGIYLRCIGAPRAAVQIGLMNLTYNLARYAHITRSQRAAAT
jgi:IS5 family transposase